MFNPREQARLAAKQFDATEMVCKALNTKPPWDSIVDFATHQSFCGFPIFPRQATLLKLIFLETENMTQYDMDIIERWRWSFVHERDTFGVQPDIWHRIEYLKKRGYRRFPHIQMVLGRRASKGAIGGLLGCEQIAFLHSKDNPQRFYGIAENKDMYLNVGGTSQTQAARQLFADVRTMVEQCQYFYPKGQRTWLAETKDHVLRVRTPADLRRIAELQADGAPVDHVIATLVASASAASSVAGRGQTSFGNFYDEFAFHVQTGSVKSDSEIYKDWQPSLGQLKTPNGADDSLTYLPSSPATKAGQFYVLYEQGKVTMSTYDDETGLGDEARQNLINVGLHNELECEPTWLIFQGPSWGLYEDWQRADKILGRGYAFSKPPEPDLKDERQIRERTRDPVKFRVEKQGQFAEVIDQYLDTDKVDDMFRPLPWRDVLLCQYCNDFGFDNEGNVCPHPLAPVAFGTFDRKYRIHCDPGRTGANFSLAVAHLEDAPPDEHGRVWPHVVFDFLKVWRPMDFPPDVETKKRTIDYVQVHSDIEDIVSRFMSTEKISFDQWNSASFIASLRQKFMPGIRVAEVTFAEKENQIRCEKFKSAVNLGWVHAYPDNFYHDDRGCLLAMELKFLSEKNGKVVRQETGPVTTKDLADAVMVVTVDLLHAALDRWSSGRLTAGAFGSTHVAAIKSGSELDRLAEGRVRDTKAWRALDEQKIQRVAQATGRSRGRYQGDRLSSIHNRTPKAR